LRLWDPVEVEGPESKLFVAASSLPSVPGAIPLPFRKFGSAWLGERRRYLEGFPDAVPASCLAA
jgi:hypothetical protein